METTLDNKKMTKKTKTRIIEIDFIRGFCILLMFIDHLLYDGAFLMTSIFKIPYKSAFYGFVLFSQNYWNSVPRLVTRIIVLAIFFLVSGVCCNFSRNNLKRSLLLLGLGGIIDLGFLIFSLITKSNYYVFFGAITCFGVSIFIFWLIKFIFDKIKLPQNAFKWASLSLGLIFIICGIFSGGFKLYPDWVNFLTADNWFFVIVGNFGFGEDWLPLFPYIGFIFIGAFLGQILYQDKKSYFKPLPSKPSKEEKLSKKIPYYSLIMPYKCIKNSIAFTGKYSIWFYIGHQVIIILILSIICLAMGFSFAV